MASDDRFTKSKRFRCNDKNEYAIWEYCLFILQKITPSFVIIWKWTRLCKSCPRWDFLAEFLTRINMTHYVLNLHHTVMKFILRDAIFYRYQRIYGCNYFYQRTQEFLQYLTFRVRRFSSTVYFALPSTIHIIIRWKLNMFWAVISSYIEKLSFVTWISVQGNISCHPHFITPLSATS